MIIHGNQSSNPISPKTLNSNDALHEMIPFGQMTLETNFFENVNGQPMDGQMDLGRRTIAIFIHVLT